MTVSKRANAQEYSLTHYGVADGLGASGVHTLYQDSRGYIWVSTNSGLNRFDGTSFKEFTQKDGLSRNPITSIHEDEEGNLWLKSRLGYSRMDLTIYDGRRFQAIAPDSMSRYGGDAGGVLAYRDQYEPLWVRRGDTVFRVDKKRHCALSYDEALDFNYLYGHLEVPNTDTMYLASIRGLMIYNNGSYFNLTKSRKQTTQIHQIEQVGEQIWLVTDEGLFEYANGNFDNSRIPKELHKNVVHNIQADQKGRIWMATVKGLYCYEAGTFTRFTRTDGLVTNRINRVFVDSRDNVWLSTEMGLLVYHNKQFVMVDAHSEGVFNGRYAQTIVSRWGMDYRQILEDHEGNIWFNTENGIAKFSGFSFAHYNKENLLESIELRCLLKDGAGRLWLGYHQNGFSICEGDSSVNYVGANAPDQLTKVNALVADEKGTVYIGSDKGLHRYDGSQFTNISSKDSLGNAIPVLSLLVDQQQQVWSNTQEGIFLYTGEQVKEYRLSEDIRTSHPFFAMHEDGKGQLWVSNRDGLHRFEAAIDSFRLIGHSSSIGFVGDIEHDQAGNLWLVNVQGGLSRYDGKYAIHFNEKDGFNTSNIYGIEILDDYAWLATAKGIEYFQIDSIKTPQIIHSYHIGATEGFLPIECTGVMFNEKQTANLWLGTPQGLTKLDINSYLDKAKQVQAPQVRIKQVKVGLEEIDWIAYADAINPRTQLPEHPILDFKDNNLSFEFESISYTSPQKAKFLYQLEGYDEEWGRTIAGQEVNYINLPAGAYTMAVKAFYEDYQQTGETVYFPFTINQPVWSKIWFWALCTTLLLSCILIAWVFARYVRWRQAQRWSVQ